MAELNTDSCSKRAAPGPEKRPSIKAAIAVLKLHLQGSPSDQGAPPIAQGWIPTYRRVSGAALGDQRWAL
jgi:hypothetical protein